MFCITIDILKEALFAEYTSDSMLGEISPGFVFSSNRNNNHFYVGSKLSNWVVVNYNLIQDVWHHTLDIKEALERFSEFPKELAHFADMIKVNDDGKPELSYRPKIFYANPYKKDTRYQLVKPLHQNDDLLIMLRYDQRPGLNGIKVLFPDEQFILKGYNGSLTYLLGWIKKGQSLTADIFFKGVETTSRTWLWNGNLIQQIDQSGNQNLFPLGFELCVDIKTLISSAVSSQKADLDLLKKLHHLKPKYLHHCVG